jgi:hypothetical protein
MCCSLLTIGGLMDRRQHCAESVHRPLTQRHSVVVGQSPMVPSRPTAQDLAYRVGDSEHSKLARLFRRHPPDAPRRIPAVPRFT